MIRHLPHSAIPTYGTFREELTKVNQEINDNMYSINNTLKAELELLRNKL